MIMGYRNLKAVLLIMSTVVILLFTGSLIKVEAAAKASDFVIKNGILKQYIGSDKEIMIPKGVITIGAGAFKDSKAEKVTIPDGVQKIEEEAFQNCDKLTKIVIPNSVLELGQSAFQGCDNLSRVELFGELYVGMSAFADCTSLKHVIIPEGANTFGNYAFKNCTSLEVIDLPDSISFIGSGCFENCISLETILFPSQETFFGYKAFYNTLWLNNYEGDNVIINNTLIEYRGNDTEITIPENITAIGYGAFENCSFITKVKLPIGLKEIGNSAFAGCSGLTEIVLPISVARVGAYSFGDCSRLEKITIPKEVNIRRDSLEGTKWMTDFQGDFIVLNGNLLGYQGTSSKIVIPDNVTTVCTGAFINNDYVTEITVPKYVTKMYYAGFSNCKYLQRVYITGKSISVEYQTFLDNNSNLTIYGIAGGAAEDYANQHDIRFARYGLSKTKVTLYLGGDSTTSLSLNGFEAKAQWETEDATIAKVNKDGKVTAVKTGTTKVNAMVNGITMTCEIVVKKPYISKSSVSIMIGRTSRLDIIGISAGYIWVSSNKSIASVNKEGVVTAKKAGTAIITATIKGKKYICKVTVK